MAESANDRFERLAAEFHAATGMLAPGKDDASGAHTDERRRDAWAQWLRERQEALERDAARYRFLRDNPLGFRAVDGNASVRPHPDVRDRWVDAAMEEQRAALAAGGAHG